MWILSVYCQQTIRDLRSKCINVLSQILMEQQAVIRFHVLLGKTASKTFKSMKNAYGNNRLSSARVFEWFNHFIEEQVSLEDNERIERVAP